MRSSTSQSGRRLTFAVAVLMILSATTACGGSDEDAPRTISESRDPAVWAADLCGHLNVFIDGIVAVVENRDAAAAVTPTEDLEAVREDIIEYFDEWKASADTFMDGLGGIGHPDLPGGEIAAQSFWDEYGKLSPAAADAAAAVAALPTDDPVAFWAALETIETKFGEAARLGDVNYPSALMEFFDAEPACAGWSN